MSSSWRSPLVVIAAGCVIAMIGFGVRSVFGLFQEPVTLYHGWNREVFALALAVQNLLWGLGVPVAGMIADRFGPSRVIIFGAIVYAFGIWAMSVVESGTMFVLAAGVLVGLGVAFTAFSLALASMARVVATERRSFVLGLGTAAGSFGQFVFSPNAQFAISLFEWQGALIVLAAASLVMIPLAIMLPAPSAAVDEPAHEQGMREAIVEAGRHSGYVLLTLGFFVCGFQIAFITVHFPAFVTGSGFDATVAAWSLGLVGIFNIAGCLLAGVVGQRWSKRYSLSVIYFLRAVLIVALMLVPRTETTIYLFAGCMGLVWLATVPLTSGIVAQVFGTRYMATLFGIVFFSHQAGSFIGVWLGGRLFDATGSYDVIWWISAVLGLLACLVHLPINERPLARLAVVPERGT